MIHAYRAAVLKLAVLLLLPLSLLAALSMMGGRVVYGDADCILFLYPTEGPLFGAVVDLRTSHSRSTIISRQDNYSISPDGRYKLTRSEYYEQRTVYNRLTLLDTYTQREKIISHNALDFFWSPDSQVVAYLSFAHEQNQQQLSFVNQDGEALMTLGADAFVSSGSSRYVYGFGFSADSQFFSYGSGNAVVFVDMSSYAVHQITLHFAWPNFAWSPLGHELLILSVDQDDRFRLNIVTPHDVRLLGGGSEWRPLAFNWSPNGQYIAVQTNADGNNQLRRLQITIYYRSGAVLIITDALALDDTLTTTVNSLAYMSPSWSADGDEITIWRSRPDGMYDRGYFNVLSHFFEPIVENVRFVVAAHNLHRKMIIVSQHEDRDQLQLISMDNSHLPVILHDYMFVPRDRRQLMAEVASSADHIRLSWHSRRDVLTHVLVVDLRTGETHAWAGQGLYDVHAMDSLHLFLLIQNTTHLNRLLRLDIETQQLDLLASSRNLIAHYPLWSRSGLRFHVVEWVSEGNQNLIRIIDHAGFIGSPFEPPLGYVEMISATRSMNDEWTATVANTNTTQGGMFQIRDRSNRIVYEMSLSTTSYSQVAWRQSDRSLALIVNNGPDTRFYIVDVSEHQGTYSARAITWFRYLEHVRGLQWLPCALDPA